MGDRRLFTIGIGPSPNTFFLTKAAQFGRGTFTFIGDVREVKEKMGALFRKLENPALTDVTIDWPGGADAWPRPVPDLYAGEPVIVTAQFPAGTMQGNVAISGKRADRRAGVAAGQWRRIRTKMSRAMGARENRRVDGRRPARARNRHSQRGARHRAARHLVSKYTSLVAVDVTPTRPAGTDVVKSAMPGNVPEGLTGFSQLPRTATPAALLIVIGLVLLLAAAALIVLRRPAALAEV